jgi:hypothetical protein
VISIDTLPDEAVLAIFDHYMYDVQLGEERQRAWLSLVHVCRRWRSIAFESPRRLNLRLVCRGGTPARDRLDVWPALPLIILVDVGDSIRCVDNIVAVLERSDRVCQINLVKPRSWDMEMILAAMQQPFPELARLGLELERDGTVPVVPDSFLGGSAPRLEHLTLDGIPFPGLPRLLSSATHLANLTLWNIPHSGYFSPPAIVTILSTLTSLSDLWLGFQSPRYCPDRASRRPHRSTRSVLPVLTTFRFNGVTEYLEDLVTCIDAPKLNLLDITFFNDIVFYTPHLIRFISRTPKSKALEEAHITLRNRAASVNFSSQTSRYGDLKVEISCKGLDWQLSSLEQVCTSCLPPLSMLEDLYFYGDPQPDWKDNTDNGLWVELLRPFSAVKNLYLSDKVASRIVPALRELVEGRRTTEVLPTLQHIFSGGLEFSGPVQEGIGKFVAARQVAGRPTAVSHWTNYQQRRSY